MRHTRQNVTLGALLVLALLSSLEANQLTYNTIKIEPTDQQEDVIFKAAHVVPTVRQLAYHEREFIAMICLGPNTFTRKEWGNGMEDPVIFNPQGLDTDQWCRAMQAAGMKLVVLVAKHHDGFCLWQTRYTTQGVMSSSWREGQGDVLKDLSASCQKYGLKLGVYLSPADLHQIESPDGLYGNLSKYTERVIPRPVTGRPFKDKRTFKLKVDDYNEYFLNQLFELLTEYGPVHEVWFDGAHPKRKGGQTYTHDQWYQLIRTLAPEAVIFGKGPDVRWCGNEAGATRPAEWNVVPLAVHPDQCTWPDLMAQDIGSREKLYAAKYLYYAPAETNTSIRAGWYYRDDTHQQVRTADDIFNIYERSVGGNSVFLLNIPPNRQGLFSPRDEQALVEAGKRIRETYGHSLLQNVQGPTSVTDSDIGTFWSPSLQEKALVLTLPSPVRVNRFVIQEALATHGQRIEQHALDVWLDTTWQEVAAGTTVGFKRILTFPTVTTDRLRLRIPEARLISTVSEVSAHYSRARPVALSIRRDNQGRVTISRQVQSFGWKPHRQDDTGTSDLEIRYTTDGTEPGKNATIYKMPFRLTSGTVKAQTFTAGDKGPVAEEVFGILKRDWRVLSVSSEHSDQFAATKAFDGDPGTFWHTSRKAPVSSHPHHLALDLGSMYSITGFGYLPRQDRQSATMVEKGSIEISVDGKQWDRVEDFEFGNLFNDPTQRVHRFEKTVKARYLKLVSTAAVEGKPYAGAAEIEIFGSQAGRPKVLIIGDSISLGYTPFVKQVLAGKVDVQHNPGNAQATAYGLEHLDTWLGMEAWDVIHFNWGLWDLCYRHPDSKVYGQRDKERGTLTTTLEQYRANLEAIVPRLKETNAQLIFATTTPVPQGEAGRFPRDVVRYNIVAKEVMTEHGVVVNDLFACMTDHMNQYQVRAGDVHFTEAGYAFLAREVVRSVRIHYDDSLSPRQ